MVRLQVLGVDRRRRVAEHLLEDRQVHLRAASNNHDCFIIIASASHRRRRAMRATRKSITPPPGYAADGICGLGGTHARGVSTGIARRIVKFDYYV